MMKNLLFSFPLLLLTVTGFSQSYIPYYGTIVEQCSQANITNNLTEYEAQGKVTIYPTKFGIVDFYPKSNKILIRKENKWITGGLRWIISSLLNGN